MKFLKEIGADNGELAAEIVESLDNNFSRHSIAVKALKEKNIRVDGCPELKMISSKVDILSNQLDERISALRKKDKDSNVKQLQTTVNELRANELLAIHKKQVTDEVENNQKIAAYGLCLNDVKTQSIIQKSTAVTKSVVTSKLRSSFQNELNELSFRYIEVELKEAGGTDGVLFHKLILVRAPGSKLPYVVSEGEQRCLSIAVFFAELSTTNDKSGIVFDDPV